MRRLANNVLSILFTFVKFSLMKMFNWRGFRFSAIERFSPGVVTEFNQGSKVVLGPKVRVHSGTKLKVRRGAKLDIGANVRINYGCIVVCRDAISIGAGTEFGPSVFLYDHDHDYRVGLKSNKFKSSPIRIGRNCWIGAHTVILRGTELGDNCVVGAGSVLCGKHGDNTLVIQKRATEARSIPQQG